MTSPLVLLVEDDAPTRAAVARSLVAHGYDVDEAPDAAAAIHEWERARPDHVILDLGLPDADGMVVLERVRAEASTPVLVLTARDANATRSPRWTRAPTTMSRSRSAWPSSTRGSGAAPPRRRARRGCQGTVELGSLTLDIARHAVTVAGQPVRLTPREFEVLKVLVAHAGRLVTHGRLLRAVWGRAYDEESHYLHVYVSRIRASSRPPTRTDRSPA